MTLSLTSEQVDGLLKILEESTRAGDQVVARFIEPASGTLIRAKSRRHHIIFGRRGSGKSSLLRKATFDLSLERIPNAFVDLEVFKGHSYPDVLISVLIASLTKLDEWLVSTGGFSSTKTSFWNRFFGQMPKHPPLNKEGRKAVLTELRSIKTELEQWLFEQDGASIKETKEAETGSSVSAGVSAGIDSLGAKVGATAKENEKSETQEQKVRSKNDFLNRSILRFKKIFEDVSKLSNGNCFLILDDLYHLKREDQAQVLDYFHRISKNSGLWIKVGTIRHRTDHYRYGNPPVGMKLGDDAEEIDLDITLEKYDTAKSFLAKVLDGLLKETEIRREKILSNSALDRLVLASGGVARDFLSIFQRAIIHARERGDDTSGSTISVVDVNRAAGEHDTSKRDDFRRDTNEDTERIEKAFNIIRDFCLTEANANCFLIEKDVNPQQAFIVDELVDLKMFHLINSRVTIPDRAKKYYKAFMLDLSQYTGDRKRRNLEMIEFWDASKREQLRKVSLVFDLSRLS